jgi:3-oxoacyl-[acyl-carrier protein] reductase
MDMSKLEGKVAIVTGASKGIGAAIAKSPAAEGASVVVNFPSSKAGADTVVSAITAAGGEASPSMATCQGPPRLRPSSTQLSRTSAVSTSSSIAPAFTSFLPIDAFTEEHYNRIFNVNVLGLLLTAQAAVKHLGEGASPNGVSTLAGISRTRMGAPATAPSSFSATVSMTLLFSVMISSLCTTPTWAEEPSALSSMTAPSGLTLASDPKRRCDSISVAPRI